MPISALCLKKDVLLCFTFWLSLAKAKKLCLKEGNSNKRCSWNCETIHEYFQQHRMCVQLLTKTEPC